VFDLSRYSIIAKKLLPVNVFELLNNQKSGSRRPLPIARRPSHICHLLITAHLFLIPHSPCLPVYMPVGMQAGIPHLTFLY